MGTITVSVEDEIENRFRRTVKKTLGTGKGKLGTAFREAMKKWVEEKEQKRIAQKGLELLRRGFDTGGIAYKHRDELHERP